MRRHISPGTFSHEEYTSKTKRGECKEEKCKELRQDGSSRCKKHSINK